MDILSFNRAGWDKQVETGTNPWTIPVMPEQVAAARKGEWQVLLTPTHPVPRSWFPETLAGVRVLCLASGGGQQGPIFAAAGMQVTVLDNSPKQLERDRQVAQRDGLEIRTVPGDMADLSVFADESFDLVFNPVSTIFVPDVLPIWRECYRVLRHGGELLVGMAQPHIYCLDLRDGVYHLRFALPYADSTSISEEERARRFGADTPYEFSHTFSHLLGGQMAAGFHLLDLYEDLSGGEALDAYMPSFMATRARKI